MNAQNIPVIEEVYTDTPAAKGNLTTGDQIIIIGGLSTKDLTEEQVIKRLTGKPGTRVKIDVIRNRKKFAVSLTRMKLKALDKTQPDLVADYLLAHHK